MDDPRRFAPASARNRDPILEVLRRFVAPGGAALEIASGSGEHAVFLAQALGARAWQPSDPDPDARASIDAWRAHAGPDAARVAPALALDVTSRPWPVEGPLDLVVCINMIHISPWASCEALVAGAAEVLRPKGLLYLYGPYKRGGEHTAPSNAAFDESLRSRNPAWGVRDLDAVRTEAKRCGFSLLEVVPMPANNFSVIFERSASRP
jgi:hypothetical protein